MLLKLQQYLFWICFVILVNMTIKFRQFQKIRTCLTSCQTTSGAPIGDLIVAFCTHFICKKSHERTAPNAEQKFFTDSKTELGAFFTPKRNTRVNVKYKGNLVNAQQLLIGSHAVCGQSDGDYVCSKLRT